MAAFDFDKIEKQLDYTFRNKTLLAQAFTHSSYANAENVADNERMEFLGDAILSEIVSEYIYTRYKNCSVGELTKIRSAIVSAEALRPIVDKLDIMQHLLVASRSGKIKQTSKKLEANLYEAVLSAIYLDGGFGAAKAFAVRTLSENLNNALSVKVDYKTQLQEYCQQRKKKIEYKLIERDGPDNCPTFKCALYIDGREMTFGVGGSKKSAEQDGAKKLVEEWRID